MKPLLMRNRRFVSLPASMLLGSILASQSHAASGNFNPYLVTRQGAGNDVYTFGTTGTSFGTITNGTTWLLEGGEITGWGDGGGGDTATGANLFYRAYRDSEPAPVFTSQNLPFLSQSGNDKKWQKSDLGNSLTGSTVQLFGATYNGSYKIDYYFQANFNWGSQYNYSGTSTATVAPTSNFYTATYTLSGFDYSLDSAVGSTQNQTYGAAVMTGSVGIGKFGSGTVQVNSTSNSYTGRTLIAAGTLQTTASGVIPDTSSVLIKAGAVLDLNGNNETVATVQEYAGSDGGTISLGSGTLTLNGANKGAFNQNSISGSGGLTMAGSGSTTLNLYGTQSYTGTTTVSGGQISSGVTMGTSAVVVSGGKFEMTADNKLSDTATLSISGGSLDLLGSDTVASISATGGAITLGAGKTLTVNASSSIGLGSTISGGTLKASGGTLTFNSTSGNTSALVIDSTATLGGTGTIGGATTITGTHAAGNNGIGTQTFSSSLAYVSNSIFSWDLNGTTTDPGANTVNAGSYDKVVAAGAVTGSSVFTIVLGSNFFSSAFWDTNKSWTDIFTTGAGSSTLQTIFSSFNGSGVASNGLVTGEGQFSFSGNTMNWTAVPEPSGLAAGILLVAGMIRRKRSR